MYLGRSFESRLRSGETSQKHLAVLKEVMAEKAAAAITRKLEKKEKKCFKEGKETVCLSENISNSPEECEKDKKKKKKKKP